MPRSVVKNIYLGNDTNGTNISDRVTYMRFAESIKGDDSLVFFAEGEDAAYLLELDALSNGKPVVFNFGYVGAELSPTYRALITDVEVNYGTDTTLLTVKCGDRGRTLRKVSTKKVWKKKSTDQIFKEIANMHGMNTYIEVPVGGFMQWASLPQESMSNMDFLQMLAAREKDGNYICFVHGDDLHLVTRNVDIASQNNIIVGEYENLVSFNIRWRETTAPAAATEVGVGSHKVNGVTAKDNVILGESGIYTMTGAVYFKDASGKRTLLIEDNGRVTEEGQKVFKTSDAVDNLSHTITTAQKNTPPQQKTKVGDATYLPLPADKATSIKDKVEKSLFTNGMEMISPDSEGLEESLNHASSAHKTAVHKVLTADMVEFGNPLRKCHTVITVGGVATRFIGNWMIESVSHDVGPDQYNTTSNLTKNGIKKGGTKAADSNAKPADKDKEDGKVYIGLQGRDNGRVYEKDKTSGKKKTVEFTPYKP